MALMVNEIFYSLQGESTHAGRPCVFVRLSGCNLRCAYCDSAHAYEPGRSRRIDWIVELVQSYGVGLVEITGGEPLMQADTPRLARRLLDNDFQVLVETNGSLDIDLVSTRCTRVVDIKCPSSGEEASNDLQNLNRLTPGDELKFVIGDEADYAFACGIIESFEARKHVGPIHFAPVFGRQPARDLARWILDDRLDVRLQLQIHKQIWDPDQRGV